MGLFKCPDCGKKVSDRLYACPKCGCPFTEEMKARASVANVNEKNDMKEAKRVKQLKFDKKNLFIAVIAVIVIVAIIVALYFVINWKNIHVDKAEEYIANHEYAKAVEKLEKYKDDDDIKEMYEDAVFMTTDEGEFLLDFAQGLMERWDISDAGSSEDTYRKSVDTELNRLDKYRNVTFDDETFNEKAHAYLDALDLQSSALDYVKTNYSKYSNDWAEGYKQRTVLLTYFLNNYNVPIEEKYAKIKSEFMNTASAVSAQTELENQIYAMVHEASFEKYESSYGWEKYRIQVENKTDNEFSSFNLVVNCLDADGNVLDQNYTNTMRSFAPGQKATFEFSTDKAPASLTWEAEYYLK